MKFTPYIPQPELTPAFVAQVLHMVLPIGKEPYVYINTHPGDYTQDTVGMWYGQVSKDAAAVYLRRQEIQIGRHLFAVWVGQHRGVHYFTYASPSHAVSESHTPVSTRTDPPDFTRTDRLDLDNTPQF